MKNKQGGFTLVEIAIVLVIIGLLLGGVLKGQELINSAKVKNFASDFRNIPLFIYGYQDKFRAIPGDDLRATVNVGSAKNGDGDGVIEGNWFDGFANTNSETVYFWEHVRLANLATGPTSLSSTANTTAFLPSNADGGKIGIQSGTTSTTDTPIIDKAGNAIRGTYVVCSTGVLGKYVKQLDITMDDGETGSGSMLAAEMPTGGLGSIGKALKAKSSSEINDSSSYIVCLGF